MKEAPQLYFSFYLHRKNKFLSVSNLSGPQNPTRSHTGTEHMDTTCVLFMALPVQFHIRPLPRQVPIPNLSPFPRSPKKQTNFGDTQGSSPHRSSAHDIYVGSGKQSWVQPFPPERRLRSGEPTIRQHGSGVMNPAPG